MPGVKLHFLKNAPQRVANARPLPLKQVEAIVLYGKPEQRAKVVEKLLPNAYGLALNSTTHHVLMALLDRCDNMDRVKLLYNLRQKMGDLTLSAVGNKVVQKLLDHLPKRQRSEIAQSFVLNAEEDELKLLCQHPFGNHVAQKMMEFKECVEILEPFLKPQLRTLAAHSYGMRVLNKYIHLTENGWKLFVEEVLGVTVESVEYDDSITEEVSKTLDASISALFRSSSESMAICALIAHPFVPLPVKDAICAHLAEYVEDYITPSKITNPEEKDPFALPDFSSTPKKSEKKVSDQPTPLHVHTYCSLFENGTEEQRELLWSCIVEKEAVVQAILTTKKVTSISLAAVRFHEGSRSFIYKSLCKGRSLADVSADPIATLILRAFIEVDSSKIPKKDLTALLSGDLTDLAKNPLSSPVLQKLIEIDPQGRTAKSIFNKIKADLPELVQHTSGSFLVQSVLLGGSEELRAEIVSSVLEALGELKDAISYAQGSRVLQKALVHAPDDVIVSLVQQLKKSAEQHAEKVVAMKDEEGTFDAEEEKEDEEKPEVSRSEQRKLNQQKHYHVRSDAILSYATHAHACYVIQTLLLETRKRQLEEERRWMMNELKPFVFDLAISPWAGRVVLDAMLEIGSAELKAAIMNVVFLKAEAWLSEGAPKGKRVQQNTLADPTIRHILKRKREENQQEKNESDLSGKKGDEHKKRKIHRILKR